MKLIKKIATGLLALTMSFSFVACEIPFLGDLNEAKGSSSSWGTGNPNNPDDPNNPNTPNTPSTGGSTQLRGDGAKYLSGLVSSVSNAQTLEMSVEFLMDYQMIDRTFGTYVYGDSYSYYDDENDSQKMYASANFAVTLTKADPFYNVHLKGSIEALEEYYEYWNDNALVSDSEIGEVEVYVIGETVYYRAQENGEVSSPWYKQTFSWEEILESVKGDEEVSGSMAMLEDLYNQLVNGDVNKIYNLVGPLFEQTMNIDLQNQTYGFQMDVANDVNTALDTITGLNYYQSLTEFTNYVLAELDAEVTLDDIFAEVITYGDITVREVYNQLNQVLQTETGMNVNELKNYVISETLATVDLEMLKNYIPESDLAMITDVIAQIQNTNVEEILQPYMDLTVDDLLAMMLAPADPDVEYAPEQTPTVESLINNWSAMLNEYTLYDVLNSATDGDFDEILEVLNGIHVDALEQNASVKFSGYKVSDIHYDAAENVTIDLPSTIYVKAETKIEFSVSLKNTPVTFTAPEGAVDASGNQGGNQGSPATERCVNCGSNVNLTYFSQLDVYFCADCISNMA